MSLIEDDEEDDDDEEEEKDEFNTHLDVRREYLIKTAKQMLEICSCLESHKHDYSTDPECRRLASYQDILVLELENNRRIQSLVLLLESMSKETLGFPCPNHRIGHFASL